MTVLKDDSARKLIRTALDRNVFVDAGAGSGKTRSFVDRVCALVDAGHDISGIVSITFTEKAAAELRTRIRAELLTDAQDPLRKQALDRLDAAPIGTIHSFAGRLLRENPVEAGVPPLLTINDELGSAIAFERRWERARDTLFSNPASREAIDELIARGVTLQNIRDVAEQLDQLWHHLDVNPGLLQPPAPLQVERAVGVLRDLVAWRSVCLKPDGDSLCAKLDTLAERAEVIATLAAEVNSSESASRELVDALESLTWPAKNLGSKVNWGEHQDGVKSAVVDAREAINEILTQPIHESVDLITRLLGSILAQAAVERQVEGELEFHDLLVLAARLVSVSEEVWQRIQRRYPIVMLDEFQDTDPLQAELAIRIASQTFIPADGDWRSATLRHGALFTVGDPKQSIYRFRQADIATFLGAKPLMDDRVILSTNFRSSAPVLAWVNRVFTELIREDDLKQPEYQPLDVSEQRSEWNATWGPAVTLLAPETEPASALEAREAEARDVAHLIRRAVGLDPDVPAWIHRYDDKQTKEMVERPLELSDVCILLPSRTNLLTIQDALDSVGIDYIAEASSLVYSSEEVHDLIVTLKAIANTANKAALVVALRSPVFGCSDEELLRWVTTARGGEEHDPWNLFGQNFSEDADNRIERGLALIQRLVRSLPTLSPAELLEEIVVHQQVLQQAIDQPRRAREVWRRIRYIIDQAEAWYENTHGSLRDYISWAELQQDESARVRETIVPESGVNAVRIMTVHTSKGLEFPMVVVAGATSSRPLGAGKVALDSDGGIQVRLVSTSSGRTKRAVETRGYPAAAEVEKSFLLAERKRLLYVACTRAETHLVVSTHVSPRGAGQAFSVLLNEAAETLNLGAETFTAYGLPDVDVPDEAPLDAPVLEMSDEVWSERYEQWQRFSAQPASFSITALAHESADAPVANPFSGSAMLRFVPDPNNPSPSNGDGAADAGTAAGADADSGKRKSRVRFQAAGADDDEPREPEAENPEAAKPEAGPGAEGAASAEFDGGHAVGISAQPGSAARLGTAVHKTIELCDLRPTDSLDSNAQIAAAESELAGWQRVADYARSAIESEPVKRAAEREHWLELPMTMSVDDVVLEGVADLVYREDNGSLVIVDFKTNQELSQKKLDEYWAQLTAYANILHRVTGEPVAKLVLIQNSQTPALVYQAYLSSS